MLWFSLLHVSKIAWWVNNHGFRHGRRNNICLIKGIIPLSLFMFRGVSCAVVALRRAKSAARLLRMCAAALDDGRRQLDGLNCLVELGGTRIEVQVAVRRTEHGLFYRGWKKVEEDCGGYLDQLVSAHTFCVFCKNQTLRSRGGLQLYQIFQLR